MSMNTTEVEVAKQAEQKRKDDALAQLFWVIDNSEGVVGLRAGGGVMDWAEVQKLAPHVARKGLTEWRW